MGDIAGFGFPPVESLPSGLSLRVEDKAGRQQTLTNSNVKKHNFLRFQRSACQDILNIVAFQKGCGNMAILTLSDRKLFIGRRP